MTEPGEAITQRLSDGTRVVTQASQVIRPDGTLRLDGPDRIYERVIEGQS